MVRGLLLEQRDKHLLQSSLSIYKPELGLLGEPVLSRRRVSPMASSCWYFLRRGEPLKVQEL